MCSTQFSAQKRSHSCFPSPPNLSLPYYFQYKRGHILNFFPSKSHVSNFVIIRFLTYVAYCNLQDLETCFLPWICAIQILHNIYLVSYNGRSGCRWSVDRDLSICPTGASMYQYHFGLKHNPRLNPEKSVSNWLPVHVRPDMGGNIKKPRLNSQVNTKLWLPAVFERKCNDQLKSEVNIKLLLYFRLYWYPCL